MILPKRLYRLAGLACICASLAGCGSEAETAEAPGQLQPLASGSPLAEIPREEIYGASPAQNLWNPQIELEVLNLPPGWDGARIAIVSDLQLGQWDENEAVAAAAVQNAVDASPDLVALLGDFLAPGGEPGALERVLAPLRGQRAVAVLGARDVRADSIEATVTGILESSGVLVLKNTAVPIELRGDTAWVAGLDPGIVRTGFGDQQFILATLGQAERTPLMLTYLPALAIRAPMGRFPVVVAGNTHCGEVEVPGTPRLSWLRSEIFPNGAIAGTDRLFRVQGGTVVISCGVGHSFLPLRFGAAPEVPVVTLRRVGSVVPAAESRTVADTLIERFQPQTTTPGSPTTPPSPPSSP